jgi:hypothetical protein
MDWMKITSALVLGAMLVYLFPRARAMMKHSPRGSGDDWRSVLIPLAGVILFVIFLISMVR